MHVASFPKVLDELELCSSNRRPVLTIEDNLKAVIARKEKVYVASHAIDVSHLMCVLLCRLGMLDMASDILR